MNFDHLNHYFLLNHDTLAALANIIGAVGVFFAQLRCDQHRYIGVIDY